MHARIKVKHVSKRGHWNILYKLGQYSAGYFGWCLFKTIKQIKVWNMVQVNVPYDIGFHLD